MKKAAVFDSVEALVLKPKKLTKKLSKVIIPQRMQLPLVTNPD